MKPLILAGLTIFAVSAPRADALPPTTRTLQGEVVAVEREHKRFTVRTVKTPAGVPLAWRPQTRFVRDGKFVGTDSLKPGQQVTVRYRAPFFGPHLAGRVIILSVEK